MPENNDRPVTLASLRGGLSRRDGRRPAAPEGERSSGRVEPDPPQLGLFLTEQTGEGVPPGAQDAAVPVSTGPTPRPMPAQRSPPAGAVRQAEGSDSKEIFVEGARRAPRDASRPSERPAAPAERRVWTVRGILSDLRQRVEGGYGEVWVEGEISNCRPAASGHLYLTLKDGEAQLPVVLFRRQAQLLRFRPTTGMAVLVRGRLSVYEGRGELQLIGELLEPRGAGALLLAFEQMKARLAAEGLFDAARKKALPPFPRCVGVITSTSGAVLHDIVTAVRRRHGRLNLLVFPALVQGPGCAASVAAGVRWFNRNRDRAELILIARGGGSPEDLAGFNDEGLARVIADSELPVISAVGHETDFTIADFVADLRAPTPSSAAEIMTQAQHGIEERLEALERRLKRGSGYRLLEARQRFARMSADHVLRRVQQGIDRRQQRLDDLEQRMSRALEKAGSDRLRRLEQLRARLDRQNVVTRLLWGADRLARMEQWLQEAALRTIAMRGRSLDRTTARLQALSPVAVLARGYALVYTYKGTTDENLQGMPDEVGSLITSSTEIQPGQRVRARLARGSLIARVTEIDP